MEKDTEEVRMHLRKTNQRQIQKKMEKGRIEAERERYRHRERQGENR